MRPSAMESIYRDLELKYGNQERTLPPKMLIRPLALEDSEAILALEAQAFPETERATKEKTHYRLSECPELCAGVFLRDYIWDSSASEDAPGVAAPTSSPYKETLVAHIIATKMKTPKVTLESMEVPERGPDGAPADPRDPRGTHESGRTLGIHSLAVAPEFRGRGIGYILLKDYIQKFYALNTADGIALLAHDELVPFYEKHGFRDRGESTTHFGGTSWRDLYLPFDDYDNQLLE